MKFKQLYFALVAVAFYLSMPAYAQTYAIRNARIVTVSGPVIEKGTIVIRDGLIEAVGPEARIPADAKIFEGSGLTVYPGFIDSLTNLGLPTPTPRPTPSGPSGFPLPLAAAAATSSQPSNSNYPAGLRPEELVIDELRAGDAQFESNRNAGFTTALTTGRSGIFNGQSALINLAGESVSAMTIKSPVAVHITFATIPGAYPGSLLGTFAALRQMFNDAKRLDEWKRLYAANPKGIKRPDADRSLEALIPVVKGEIPVVFVANRRNEVVRALDLAKEYNLKAVIAGGQEAGIFADRLKSQAVPVLLSLNYPKRTTAASPEADPEDLETLRFRAEAPKTPAKLAAAGVKFAFFSGGLTNLNDLFSNIRKSTENGLSRDAAIRALTLSAAEVFGVADRTGSLEAGKIANITVVKGDLLGSDRFVQYVFVDGKLFEQKPPSRQASSSNGSPGRAGAVVSAAANVSGAYSISIQAPGQALSGRLNIVQSGDSLTGTLVTDLGTSELKNGRIGPDGFTFSGTVIAGGETIDFTVRGRISGNELSGTVESQMGSFPISGTRIP